MLVLVFKPDKTLMCSKLKFDSIPIIGLQYRVNIASKIPNFINLILFFNLFIVLLNVFHL